MQQGYFDITKRLIEAGALLTSLDDEKCNIIHVCASHKHIELLKYLLEKCPLYLINEKNIYGKLPKDLSKDDAITKLLFEQEKHNNQGVRIHIFDAQSNIESMKRKRPKEIKTHASSTGNNRNININISTNIGNINNIVNQISTANLPSGANSLKKFKCDKSPNSGISIAKEADTSFKLGFNEAQASKVNIKAVNGKADTSTTKKAESKFIEVKQSKVPITQINLTNAATSTTNANNQNNLAKSTDYTDYENMSTKKFKIGGALTGKGGNAQNINIRNKVTSATKSATVTTTTTTFNSKKEFSSAAMKNNIFSNMIQKEVIDLYNNSTGNPASVQSRPETTTQKNSSSASDYFVTKAAGKPSSIDCSLSGDKIKQILSHKAFDSQHSNGKYLSSDIDNKNMEKPQKSTVLNQKKNIIQAKPNDIDLNIVRINSKNNKNESSMQISSKKDKDFAINKTNDTRSSTNKICGKALTIQSYSIQNAAANKNLNSSKSVVELTPSQVASPNIKLDLSNKQIETDSEENEEDAGASDNEAEESEIDEKKRKDKNNCNDENAPVSKNKLGGSEEKSEEIIDESNNDGTNNTNASVFEEKIGPTSFVCHALIGKGSFGEVYLVEKLNSGMLYAMKVLSKDKIMGNPIYLFYERSKFGEICDDRT